MTCEDEDPSGQVLTCIIWVKFVPFSNSLDWGSGGQPWRVEQNDCKAEKGLAVPERAMPRKAWEQAESRGVQAPAFDHLALHWKQLHF